LTDYDLQFTTKFMSFAILIAISFSAGFFFESIIGFGGGIIAYAILGFFIDLKEMVIAGLYVGTLASAYIAASDFKQFDKKIFISLIPLSLVGTVFGVLIFSRFSSQSLAFLLGILLIILAVKTIFFDRVVFPKFFKNKLIFIGGISHGIFGLGGPFVVNAIKNKFKNKSSLRTTMAVFFVLLNLVRIPQLLWQNQLQLEFFITIWWTIIPVFIAIKLGHLIHLKISEDTFKKGIAIMTIFAGLKFLSKVL